VLPVSITVLVHHAMLPVTSACTKQNRKHNSSQFPSSPQIIYASVVNLRGFPIDLTQHGSKLTGDMVGDVALHRLRGETGARVVDEARQQGA